MNPSAISSAKPGRRCALVNGRIVLPTEVVSGKAVMIEGRRILGLASPGDVGSATDRFDAGGRFITPGLIDIHTHGALGHVFNEGTDAVFAEITRENLRRGVTSLLMTIGPEGMDDLCTLLERCRAWLREPRDGAQVLGVHLESPYINPAQKGAMNEAYMRRPDDGTADRLLEFGDILRIFMLAPELPGALDLIARLARQGIIPAAGHTMAHDSHIAAAMQAGLRHVTHLWSAMSATVREGPWRKPGLVESALLFDGLTVEMISDGKHLPPTLMKLAYKCVGPDRLCAISDATSGAGLPDGARFRMHGMEYEVCDGVGMMLDRSAFAGSTTLLNHAIAVLIRDADIPLPEAVRMASLVPARIAGVDGRKGSIEAGKDADLAIFDEDFTAHRVMVQGRWADGA